MKKTISVLLVFAMIFIVIPSSTAYAQEGQKEPTRTETLDLSSDAVLAALAQENGVTSTGGVYASAEQGWSYDTNATPKTLTLSGANIKTASVCGIKLPADSKILLADGTTNTVISGNVAFGYSAAICADGTITIEGGGTLIATGGSASAGSYGINVSGGTIAIESGTITAAGGKTTNESAGIFAVMDQNGAGGVIEISGGTVSATGGAAKGSSGISARGTNMDGGAKIVISGGTVTALGGTSEEYQAFGICAQFGSIEINGDAIVSATAGDSGSVSYGIFADMNTADGEGNGRSEGDGTITISDGEITALGGTAGSSYGIFAIGTITVGNGTVTATGGTSTNVGTTGIASEAGGITIRGSANITATGGTAKMPFAHEGEGGYANSMGIYDQGGEVVIDENATVSASGGKSENESTCGIHLNKGQDGSGGILTIKGDAKVTAVGGIVVNMQNTFGGAAFIISGNAVVDVSAADITEGESLGISMTNGYLMIGDSASVTVTAGNGHYTSAGIYLGVDSESVQGNAGENDGKLIVTGGTLTVSSAAARNSKAIVAQGDIEISGGTVTARSGEATEQASAGIYSRKTISISGTANVTAKSGTGATLSAAVCADGGITIDPALSVLSPAGGAVSADATYISVAGGYADDVYIALPPAKSAAWIIWAVAIAAAGLCAAGIVLVARRRKKAKH